MIVLLLIEAGHDVLLRLLDAVDLDVVRWDRPRSPAPKAWRRSARLVSDGSGTGCTPRLR
jgi:hypothetical protein